jgi:NADH:ubiquinone oxidoreductase subunit 5 (subunit L)/multisubunit Na+/H+ antiporter MnhA subunit
MPFAGLAFGLGVFAAIGLPGFANFAGEIMIFFGAFRNGWEIGRFHIFQIATVLALWGVVLSTVYMLRAYRKTFMGSIREQWQKLPDLSPALRVPVTLLVAALLCFGFLPQFFVRNVAPMFGTFLSANTSHFANKPRYNHGAVSANGAEFIASLGQAPQGPWNQKTSALKARLIESRPQRSYWYDGIPGALPQAHMTKAPLALDRYGVVRRPGAAAVTDGDAPQAHRYNDLATK